MRLDYVDLFYSHRYDPETPLEETMQALVDIVRQGKALYVGLSNYPVETLDFCFSYLKARDVPCLIYQGRYNMMDRRVEKSGILKACHEAGVGFTAFSPLNQGLLSDRYLNGIPADSRMARNFFLKRDVLTPELIANLKKLDEIAGSRSQSLSEMALAWLLKDGMVTSVLVGASSPRQLLTNIRSVNNMQFTKSEISEIESIICKY
jgi:L-glyceraldehyde 3-phosphate reductase